MKRHLLFTLFFFISFISIAQEPEIQELFEEENEIAIDIYGFHSNIVQENVLGLTVDFKMYLRENWATGLSFSFASRPLNTNYGLRIAEPGFEYGEFSWLNQFDIYKNEKVRLGFLLSNGLGVAHLTDRNRNDEFWNEDGLFSTHQRVRTNFLYLIQPGFEANFRVYDNDEFPDIYISTEARYRKAFGNTDFGRPKDFTNFYIGFGVSLIGFW